MELGNVGGAIVDVGVTIGVVLAVVGVGQFVVRMYAGRRLHDNPNDVTSGALMLLYG
jgi:uncharacterized protein YneF (UPF0154 family)